MEPRPTTPADDLYAGAGPSEEPPAAEDWSSRYGARPPPPPPPRPSPDFSGFFLLLDGLRRAAPAELQEGLRSFIREGLLTLRSLIDWYLDRLDRPERKPDVEDIPID
jgi:hypothetical protein